MSRKNKKTECLNCNYSFNNQENYCPHCSQENHDLKIPIYHFFEEFLEGLFHFDNKIWKTLKFLFLYPGKMTQEFLGGKRVSFVPPIRLYIFFSFLFFFLLNLWFSKVDNKDQKLIDMLKIEAKKDSSIRIDDIDSFISEEIEIDTLASKDEIELEKKVKKAMNMTKEEMHELNLKVYKYMSYGLFFIMPIFALLLKLFYRKSDKYFYEHLINSLHFHAMIYIILTIALVLIKLELKSAVPPVCLGGLMIYFILSLKQVYNSTWMKSIIKGILILCIYLFLLVILAIVCSIGVLYNF